jgi:hypothetical protein
MAFAQATMAMSNDIVRYQFQWPDMDDGAEGTEGKNDEAAAGAGPKGDANQLGNGEAMEDHNAEAAMPQNEDADEQVGPRSFG